MAYKLGLDAKMFHGTAGTKASTEMKNVTDVTLNLETGEADITTRAAEGWRITAATLKEASVEFEMVWDTADAGFNDSEGLLRKLRLVALRLGRRRKRPRRRLRRHLVLAFRTARRGTQGVGYLQADARISSSSVGNRLGFVKKQGLTPNVAWGFNLKGNKHESF